MLFAPDLPPPRSPDPRRPVWPWVLAAVAAVAGFAVGYVVVAPG